MDNLVQEINELGSVSKELILKETLSTLSEESKAALLLKLMISNNNSSNPSEKLLQKSKKTIQLYV